MTTKIVIVTALLACFATVTLPADSNSDTHRQLPEIYSYLPAEMLIQLSETNRVFHYGDASDGRTLAPPLSLSAAESPAEGLQAEILQYIPADSMKSFDPDADELHRELYNLLLSVHTMQGIEYYSASRDRMRILFTESYFVDNPQNRNRVSKPSVSVEIPEDSLHYLLQDDATFGENIYRVQYTYNGETLQITMINTTSLRYGFIPAIQQGDLQITLQVHPLQDGLLLYGHIYAEPTMTFGLQSRIRNSISNRLDAVSSWFLHSVQP